MTNLLSPGRPDLLEKTSFSESMAIFAVCFPAFAVESSESSVSRRWIGDSWTMSVIAATLSAMVPLLST